MKMDEDIDEIVPQLYISNVFTSNNIDILERYRIKAVVTVINDYQKPENVLLYYRLHSISSLYIDIPDDPNANISNDFDVTYRFIKDNINKGHNVLVHCHAGISRSATIICNYLIRNYYRELSENHKVNYLTPKETVYTFVLFMRKKRPIIHPNDGFMNQLLESTKEYHSMYLQNLYTGVL